METVGLLLRSVSAARDERDLREVSRNSVRVYRARHCVEQRYYKYLLHALLHQLSLRDPMHVSGLVELTSPAKGSETASLYQPAKMEEPPRDPFFKHHPVRGPRRPAGSQPSLNNGAPITNALGVAAKGSILQAYLSLATECLHCSQTASADL